MNKLKKILFVGDLRLAGNYGAIATTETLNSILLSHSAEAEIKYIDYRSLANHTPPNGWSEYHQATRSKSRAWVKKKFPVLFELLVKWKKDLKKTSYVFQDPILNEYLPYKYDLYEKFYEKLKNKEILQYESKLLEWADIVYINGEGNFVNGTDKNGKYRRGGLYLLYIAWLAKFKYKKITCLVNHTVDPSNNDVYEIIKRIYPSLDNVLIRETLSLKKIEELGINNAKFVPDALFAYKPKVDCNLSKEILNQIDFTKPYICIGDSSGLKSAYEEVKWDLPPVYCKLISELKKIIPQIIFIDGSNGKSRKINQIIEHEKLGRINLNNCNYHELYHVLKGAEIFISGRWHASILGVLAHTPILLWGADSHKTRALYTLLDYPYNFFDIKTIPTHIDDICNEVKLILDNKDSIKTSLKEKLQVLSPMAMENASFIQKYV